MAVDGKSGSIGAPWGVHFSLFIESVLRVECGQLAGGTVPAMPLSQSGAHCEPVGDGRFPSWNSPRFPC